MESGIAKQLVDKIYEKRKAAALELERQVRDLNVVGDQRKIAQIIDQLVDMFTNVNNALHVRNGGLIGLAGAAISLQLDIASYMGRFVEPILVCFTDPENRIRYFSAECLYNIAKVSKGEILVYFNPIFDALSKLAADSESSVKNGAELLDRLLKDIVAESASTYIPQYPETEKVRMLANEAATSILVPHPDDVASGADLQQARKAFSLRHFIPLLSERIYVISPFTRSFLVAWITVLDSIPELELITYLPEFLDGLLKYLSDPTEDVRVATENILADFLREIRHVTAVRKRLEERAKAKRDGDIPEENEEAEESQTNTFSNESTANSVLESSSRDEHASELNVRDLGVWEPGQGVQIDYAAIVEILLMHVEGESDEILQSTSLRWLAEFLNVVPEVMVSFTPRLIGAVLPNLAHHAAMIQSTAQRTNKLLSKVIGKLPSPSSDVTSPPRTGVAEQPPAPVPTVGTSRTATSPTPTPTPGITRQSIGGAPLSRDMSIESLPDAGAMSTSKSRSNTVTSDATRTLAALDITSTVPLPPTNQIADPLRSHSPLSQMSAPPSTQHRNHGQLETELFDYSATVNALTIQFLSEHEETRVAALKWLIMLHQKAPKQILAIDDGTFPALLKTLSDSSEEVIKQDLQLIAQISSSSDESYFKAFMVNLLELFSTDRRLLDTRGSLIIRQLCINLNTERIYRTFAEIIEKEEDLEFASVIVQKLNLILITSPEMTEFRRRLKTLQTPAESQALFTVLYRCWSHNPVSVFSLCLLAQAYEHASNLLYIFADLEITVPLLVQIDKLVQLIESPVFTYLRLQLLEPERYPYLFKCLYGLLMLLPQSSAFISLRNRLSAVNSAGFLQIQAKPTSISNVGSSIGSAVGVGVGGGVAGGVGASARSKMPSKEEIRWQELAAHFRAVQAKHEKARRQAAGGDMSAPFADYPTLEEREREREAGSLSPPLGMSGAGGAGSGAGAGGSGGGRSGSGSGSGIKRKGDGPAPLVIPSRAGALSPLNPRARGSGLLASALGGGKVRPTSPSTNQNVMSKAQGQRAASVQKGT